MTSAATQSRKRWGKIHCARIRNRFRSCVPQSSKAGHPSNRAVVFIHVWLSAIRRCRSVPSHADSEKCKKMPTLLRRRKRNRRIPDRRAVRVRAVLDESPKQATGPSRPCSRSDKRSSEPLPTHTGSLRRSRRAVARQSLVPRTTLI